MTTWEKAVILLLGILSLVAVVVTIYDKVAATKAWQRVPEKVLLLLAGLGAAPAMYLAMRLIRHKTRKPLFMVGIPAIFATQIALAVVLYQWLEI